MSARENRTGKKNRAAHIVDGRRAAPERREAGAKSTFSLLQKSPLPPLAARAALEALTWAGAAGRSSSNTLVSRPTTVWTVARALNARAPKAAVAVAQGSLTTFILKTAPTISGGERQNCLRMFG